MLRNLIFGCFFLTALMACQSDSHTGTNNSTNAAADQNSPASRGSVVGPPMIPPQNVWTTKLMTDYWVFEFYVVPGDRVASRAGQGIWYKFNPDGTFESGRWEDEIRGDGNWYFTVEDGKNQIRLDSRVDAEDAEWEIQGETDSAMSWAGTKTYSNTGVILKALSLMTVPTRAQFGYQ